jgi:hypothetical protein
MKHLHSEINLVKEVYNAAWSKNWGSIPMTDAEFEHLADGLKMVIDPDLIFIVEAKGKPVGFGLTLPDVNDPLRRAYPSPRTPEWWTLAKFFYNMKVRKTMKYIRVLVWATENTTTGTMACVPRTASPEEGYTIGEFSDLKQRPDAKGIEMGGRFIRPIGFWRSRCNVGHPYKGERPAAALFFKIK